jgi:4-hydroxy-L-threonine phosphate dehydrogenase PdxA
MVPNDSNSDLSTHVSWPRKFQRNVIYICTRAFICIILESILRFYQPIHLHTIPSLFQNRSGVLATMSPSAVESSPSVSLNYAKRPRIALTLGDPAGVGPELGAKLLADPQNRAKADIFVLADLSEVNAAAALAGVTVPISEVAGPDGVQVLDDGSCPAIPFTLRKETKEGGERSLHQLRRAMDMANRGEIDAIVFTPLNKTSLHLAGMGELDELHWFVKYFKHDGFHCEINVIEGLWTARVTSHLGIKDVAANVTEKSVADAIELLNTLL